MATVAELKQQLIELQATLNKTYAEVSLAQSRYEGTVQTLKAVEAAAAANPQNTTLKEAVITASASAQQAGKEYAAINTQYNQQTTQLSTLSDTLAATAEVSTTSETVDGVKQNVYGKNDTPVEKKTTPPEVTQQTSDIEQLAALQKPSAQKPATSYADQVAATEAGYPPEPQREVSDIEQLATIQQKEIGTSDIEQLAKIQNAERESVIARPSVLPNRIQQSGIGSPKDWRFRMSLAPSANYLYKSASPGILKPLQATSGVIFPYSPQINVSYTASYSSSDLVHTNYKIYNYKSSSVESISITGDFTCQDSAEANYVLAVIHFFKSVTKMFYGQDQNPTRGTPPPLVYLTGFGQYQFDMHPVVVTGFTHSFPADVDYVNAYPTNNSSSVGGQNMAPYMPQIASFFSPLDRLRTLASKIGPGGKAPPPTFINSQNINEVTRVPAKITIQLTCLPIVTRNAMSNSFSLQKYASGELMRGSVNFGKTGGGIW